MIEVLAASVIIKLLQTLTCARDPWGYGAPNRSAAFTG